MEIDLSEFRTERKRNCLPRTLGEKLSPDDRAKFEAALEEKSISTRAITEWLRAKTKSSVSEAVVRHHRVKSCSCHA